MGYSADCERLLCIAKAAALGDRCFDYILGEIRPGVTERTVADKIDAFLRAHGGEALAFPTICVSGPRGCLPHGEPSDRRIERGEFLTMDFGAVIGGFCGDMTRTVAVGAVSGEQRRVYDAVLTAQRTAIRAIRAGTRCSDADKAARAVIEEAGYGAYFVHGTGHGVGAEVHEPPTLNAKSEETLEAGFAVTVEPGVYIEDKMGVRIEDLLIVTDTGIINLTSAEKDLIVL
ncbi:MAG: aminopeptidase P family protein [Clostridiales Family XIII bacterium]|jgi:Xaa-Pro aminopeptidase|nr:aminopeptidase P family protein [Clostridiales Family XIII bacterium]